MISKLRSRSASNHQARRPDVGSLPDKNFRARWSVTMVNDLPTRYGRKFLQESTTSRPSLSVEPYLFLLGVSSLKNTPRGVRCDPVPVTILLLSLGPMRPSATQMFSVIGWS